MYVLVRRDLAETYRCVQGAHALAQFAVEHPKEFRIWNNNYVIFLGVRNLIELREWHEKIEGCSLFREPDLDMQPTALAYYGHGEIFRDLKTA